MKFVPDRPFADPKAAARELMELTNAVEPVQDGRTKAGLERAIGNGWLWLHGSGTFVKLTEAGGAVRLIGLLRQTKISAAFFGGLRRVNKQQATGV